MFLALVACVVSTGYGVDTVCTSVVDNVNQYNDVQSCQMRAAQMFEDSDDSSSAIVNWVCMGDNIPANKRAAFAKTMGGAWARLDINWRIK